MKKVFIFFIFFIFFILLLISFSCKKEISKESLIYGGDKGFKYWLIERDIIYDEESPFYGEESHFFRYLDKNGKWLAFYINPKGEFVENKSPNDVIMIDTWSLLDDSTIIFGGGHFKLLKITGDTMITYNDHLKEETICITAPDSLIPKEYRRLQ